MNDPIVVDFEGFTGKPPVLVGVLVDGVFAQTAFTDVEPALAMAAQAKGLACVEFAGFCRGLVERARAERRAICGFSIREKQCIAEALGEAWPADVEYLDAKRCAKSWGRHQYPGERARLKRIVDRRRRRNAWVPRGYGNRLVDFVRLAGVRIPSNYAHGRVAATLRRIIEQARSKPSYVEFAPGAKRSWTRLLEHNRMDCVWARAFISKAAPCVRCGAARLPGLASECTRR